MWYRIIIFLIINFAALGLGGLFTSAGVSSDWYFNLNKAPWTPPGWMFGVAWTTIMICFAVYMAYAWGAISDKKLLVALFSFQWILNVSWNPVFFKFNLALTGLLIISSLTVLVGYLFYRYRPVLKVRSVFILPYLLWLIVATSLNAYIFVMN